LNDEYSLGETSPQAPPRKSFNVLSLSGGGYRGLFTARVIERLEAIDRSKAKTPFNQRFDLIVGTSIGGILAIALSCGASGTKLVEALTTHGQSIFPRLRFRAIQKRFGKTPYKTEPLARAIVAMVPNAREAQIAKHPSPVMVTTVNWTTGRLQLLGSKPTPHSSDSTSLSLMDAMLATSAAPAHFAPHRANHHVFIDGGIVANIPDLLALRCASQMAGVNSDINMLSIGTAGSASGFDPTSIPERPFTWAAPIIDLISDVQANSTVDACEQLMTPARYVRINVSPSSSQDPLVALDIANNASTDILKNLADTAVRELSQGDKNVLNRIGFNLA
jgi:predicted acylesterase/phospholipase RssA